MAGISKGIHVPMTAHAVVHLVADFRGWESTCSCGWSRSALFPASLNDAVAKAEAASNQAAHVRHMSLVHDVQTHGNNNCGALCIYPKVKQESED